MSHYKPRDTSTTRRYERLRAAREKGRHLKREWEILKEMFGFCLHCGLETDYLDKDHIVPISDGGSDDIENLQPLCQRCNSRKGTKQEWWFDWREAWWPRWRVEFYRRIVREGVWE